MSDAPSIDPSNDEQVVNLFGLPLMCPTHSVEAPDPCCNLCSDWLFCIKRTPIILELPGFDFSAWLPGVSFSSTHILPSSGVTSAEFTGGDDGTNVFSGVYLAVPDDERLTHFNCGRRHDLDKCDGSYDFGFSTGSFGTGVYGWFGYHWGWWWHWQDEGYPEGYEYASWFDYYWNQFYVPYAQGHSHYVTQPRTVLAPDASYGVVKNFYLNVRTECLLNEFDEQCVRFTVLLQFDWEKVTGACVACTADEYGVDACDVAAVAATEAAAGWGTAAHANRYCVPLLQSDLIPMEGVAWEDLTDVALHVVPPPEWTLIDADPYEPDYWIMTGGSVGGGVFPELGPYRKVGWSAGEFIAGFGCDNEGDENLGCGGTTESGIHGQHPTGHACASDVWLPVGCSATYAFGGSAELCVPSPITQNAGTAKLSLLANSCDRVSNCLNCAPDPENPQRLIAIKEGDIRFAYTGSGCAKTFTPLFPACITPAKVYWSWGEVTEGGDSIAHTIVNTASDGVQRSETVTMIMVDVRGCIYCFTETVVCGCCEGTSGSLSVTPVPNTLCDYEICATTNGTPETGDCAGKTTRIYYQYAGGSGWLASGACATITPNQQSSVLRYWVVDGNDCYSEPVDVELLCGPPCECCIEPAPAAATIHVNNMLNGIENLLIPAPCGTVHCLKLEGSYFVPATAGGYSCGGSQTFPFYQECDNFTGDGGLLGDIIVSWEIDCTSFDYMLLRVAFLCEGRAGGFGFFISKFWEARIPTGGLYPDIPLDCLAEFDGRLICWREIELDETPDDNCGAPYSPELCDARFLIGSITLHPEV